MQHMLKNWRGHWEWTLHHWPRNVLSSSPKLHLHPLPTPAPQKRLCANSQKSRGFLLKLSLLSFKHASAPSLTYFFASPSEKQTQTTNNNKTPPSSISQLKLNFPAMFLFCLPLAECYINTLCSLLTWLSPSRLARIFSCVTHAIPLIL